MEALRRVFRWMLLLNIITHPYYQSAANPTDQGQILARVVGPRVACCLTTVVFSRTLELTVRKIDREQGSRQNDAVTAEDRELIIQTHNMYRSGVNPTAANMLKMSWDDEIAMIAQAWAETCSMDHDEAKNRDIPGRMSLGQNIGDGFQSWEGVIDAWYVEVEKFTFGSDANDFEEVGHYTQGVWADSSKLGCGAADCEGIVFYVCNYGPAGNVDPYHTPYEIGEPCSACTQHCEDSLCACGDLVCENGGETDRSACLCHCQHPWLLEPRCKLNCSAVKQPYYCGKPPFDLEGCGLYDNVPHDCPTTCQTCPYGDYVQGAFTTTTTTTATKLSTPPTLRPTLETTRETVTKAPAASTTTPIRSHRASTPETDGKLPTQETSADEITAGTMPPTYHSFTSSQTKDSRSTVSPDAESGSGTTVPATSGSGRACADKFAAVGSHSACQPRDPAFLNGGVAQSAKDLIVREHNKHRSSVSPPAANMMRLRWDTEISTVAQRWAETCSTDSDLPALRSVPGRWGVQGQNMAVDMSSWSDVILSWVRERSSNASEEKSGFEKYSQMVWAQTVRVGCGFADCGAHNVYVCNYAPGMNQLDKDSIYTSGKACENCPNSCKDNLCDCGEVQCENLGVLNLTTCTCQCAHSFYHNPNCSLSCSEVQEPPFCRRSSPVTCSQESSMAIHCPNLCHVCPYGGEGYTEGSEQLPNSHNDNGTSGGNYVIRPSGLFSVLSVVGLFILLL